MKKLIYAMALVAGTALTACDDFLTEEARGTENLDTYFQNEDEASTYLNGCYQALTYNGWWQIYNPWLMFDMVTDDLWMGNTSQSSGYTDLVFFQSNGYNNGVLSNFWQYRYKGITNCNIAIARTPNANMDETTRERFVAEARFLRAFFYFDLVKNFGGVPLLTELTMPAALEEVSRSTQDECYAFIESELKAVADILPERSQYASADMGRATRGAALGFLGKAQLYQGKWAEAKATLKKVIDSGEYELMENFGDVWSVNTNNNKESLFEVQTMYNGDLYATGGSLTVVTGCRNGVGDGWSWGQPTSDLENAFLKAGDTERLRWTIIKTGCTEIAGETQFDQFIANNESGISKTQFEVYKSELGWTDDMYTSTYLIDPSQHKSARIIRKFFVPLEDRPDIYNIDKIPLNHRLLRYADVLLMYAEACNETGDDAEARTALNEVRNRVGLAAVTSSGKTLRDAIRTERRLELACEHQRLYDLRRWDCDNGKKMMCNVMGKNGSFVQYNLSDEADIYEKWNQKESSDKGANFREDRDLLFPIPLYEIQNSNGKIEQNPNW
jgi:hypothetical protein